MIQTGVSGKENEKKFWITGEYWRSVLDTGEQNKRRHFCRLEE